MENYKNEFTRFADNRIKCFEDGIIDDIIPVFQIDQGYDTSEVDENLIDQILNQISDVCNNSAELSIVLQQIISLKKLQLYDIIINSSFLPQIMETFGNNPTPILIQSICDLVFFSPRLTFILFKFNLIHILYNCIFSTNLDISQKALEFIRKILPYGIVNRAVLYNTGFLNIILQYLQNANYSSLFLYAIHTAFLFVIYDPVYGVNSYSTLCGKLPKRSIVMNQIRELNFPVKMMFNLSSFLKYGHGKCQNKAVYHLINFLLMSNNDIMCLYGARIVDFLSHRCEENAAKILQSTQFINFASIYFNCNDARIQISIFNTIRNIIAYKCANQYEKNMINLNPFLIGLQIICNDTAPTALRVAAGRCIFYGIKNIDLIQNIFSDEKIFVSLCSVYENSDIQVRAEVCCIIISILINCINNDDFRFLTDYLILSFIDYLSDYDEKQIIIILHLLFALCVYFPDHTINILSTEETVDSLYQLSSSENDDIADVSNALIEILTKANLPDNE